MKRRAVKPGELLAISAKVLEQGPKSFFWLWSSPMPVNERIGEGGQIAVVHIRGPLEHHADGFGDSYDAIRARVEDALAGEECEADETGEETGQQLGPPEAVVLRIDSPGGVVSGLNETVRALRRISAEAGIPLYAFVDEMATSAAYALASACEEVFVTPESIAGSIGVISTMVDVTKADEKMGLRFVTIVSGARKADGHPHVPITDAAIAAEQGRVDKLSKSFFELVNLSRGLPVAKIQSYQAGLFLGAEAVSAGLADGVMSWEELVDALSEGGGARGATGAGGGPGGAADSVVPRQRVISPPRSEASPMLKIKALIQSTKKALAAEKDAEKKKALTASLAHYEATLKAVEAKKTTVIEHKEKHTDDAPADGDDSDGGSGDDDGGGDSEEEEEEEEEGGNETDRSDTPGQDEDDEDDEEEEEEEEESEEEAAAATILRAAIQSLPGKARAKAKGALAALLADSVKVRELSEKVAGIERDRKAERKRALIADAAAARRITKFEAKKLGGKPLAFVQQFLEMRPKALVHSTQDDLAVPRGPGASLGLSAEQMKVFRDAAAASDGKLTVEQLIGDYRKQQASANGAGTGEY